MRVTLEILNSCSTPHPAVFTGHQLRTSTNSIKVTRNEETGRCVFDGASFQKNPSVRLFCSVCWRGGLNRSARGCISGNKPRDSSRAGSLPALNETVTQRQFANRNSPRASHLWLRGFRLYGFPAPRPLHSCCSHHYSETRARRTGQSRWKFSGASRLLGSCAPGMPRR